MYSLLWSEHCAYKHSKKLLRTLPTEGPHVVMGPGRERRRGRRRRRPGVRVQGRVPQPPQRGRALPGRGDRRRRASCATSSRSARGRSRCSTRCASASPPSAALALPARRRRRGDRPLRQLDRRADGRRRGLLRGALRAELPGQRDGPRARRARAADAHARPPGRATCSCCSAPRPGATGSAAPRCSPRPSSASDAGGAAPTSARPSRSATRSRRRSCWSARSSCSSAGCSSRCRTSAPPGLTSSASEMASKGEVGIDIDVARVPLREPDMEPFEIMVSESQERMLCVVEPRERSTPVLALCEKLGGRRRGDRHGHRQRRACACSTAASSSATCRSRALVDDCPLYDLQPASPPSRSTRRRRRRSPRRRRRGEALLALLALAQHRLAPAAVRAVRRDRAVAHRAPPRAGRRRRARVLARTGGAPGA